MLRLGSSSSNKLTSLLITKMRNLDLRHNCTNELELWIDNDEYLHQQYNRAVRIGNIQGILNVLEDMSFRYTDAQLDHLTERFNEDVTEQEERLDSYCSVLQ